MTSGSDMTARYPRPTRTAEPLAKPGRADNSGEKHLTLPAEASIGWVSARPEYWPAQTGRDELQGILCLQFGVGLAGLGWLTRLAGSDWFRGLEPQPQDAAVAGGGARGTWTGPAEAAGAFFTSASLPSASYAAVAIPDGAGPGEHIAALKLVSALRERSDPQGRRLIVVATVDASGETAFARQLLDLGAFVVCATVEGSGDHLHHFPLRTTVVSRAGRLVGIDLADILQTWHPGRVGSLYSVPFPASAERDLPAGHRCCAINIGFQLDLDTPGSTLAEMDSLATCCRERYLSNRGLIVFTNTDGMDGRGGSADLLLIRDGPAQAWV